MNTDATQWLPSAAQLTSAAAARQRAPHTPNGGGHGNGQCVSGGEAAEAAEAAGAAGAAEAAAAVLPSPDGGQALAVRFAER